MKKTKKNSICNYRGAGTSNSTVFVIFRSSPIFLKSVSGNGTPSSLEAQWLYGTRGVLRGVGRMSTPGTVVTRCNPLNMTWISSQMWVREGEGLSIRSCDEAFQGQKKPSCTAWAATTRSKQDDAHNHTYKPVNMGRGWRPWGRRLQTWGDGCGGGRRYLMEAIE